MQRYTTMQERKHRCHQSEQVSFVYEHTSVRYGHMDDRTTEKAAREKNVFIKNDKQ